MTSSALRGLGLLFAALGLVACARPASVTAPEPVTPRVTPVGERLGGDTGRPVLGLNAFALPAPNLNAQQLRDFSFGNRLFNTNWVQAGSSTESFDGLGPLFNRVSCSGCHVRDGRGRPPGPGEPMESMLVRISVPGQNAHGGPRPHPVYGDQIQDRAIPGIPAEARVEIEWLEEAGTYADGEPYRLRRPQVRIPDPGYGDPGALLTSPRVAQGMIGLGLLEAIPEDALLARADADDRDGDGISGRPNRVWDAARQAQALGRFGWKANQPTLRQQVSDAAAGDMGITSPLSAQDACTPAQKACRTAPHGGTPEMSAAFVDKLLLYSRTLAVPHRRPVSVAAGQEDGEVLFHRAGCAACHTPTWTTGAHELPALAQQTIHPFTDLLLHDMGEGLADGRPDFEADGREWRTAPLWGLGLIHTVNGHELLLHDGRARGIAEAILWHGGEAQAAREAFRAMSKPEREALLAFLRSL